MATPKLALIPTGYKAGKLYSVLPESGVGDFTVVRATEATRVNEEGLIETMGANVPRLDYSGGGCPVLLTESQRSNLLPYSEDFSNAAWIKGNVTVNANQAISPDGSLNADLIQFTVNSGNIYDNVGGSGDGSFSVFAKYIDIKYIRLRSTGSYAYFDIENGTVGNTLNVLDTKIENYGNGWYRCTVIGNNTNSLVQVFASNTDVGQPTGLGSVYLWGAQFEAGSYPTSYIKTEGSAVTRNGDQVYGSGDAATFNDSEGVLMAEISALDDDSSIKAISLNNGTDDERVMFYYSSNVISFNVSNSGVSQLSYDYNSTDVKIPSKILIKYKVNNFSVFVNGFEVHTDSVGSVPSGLNNLSFDKGDGTLDFYGKTSQIQYFNTALTDSELETLTSWTSFIEMAQALNYNII